MSRSQPHVQIAIDRRIANLVDGVRPSQVSRTEYINCLLQATLSYYFNEDSDGDVITDGHDIQIGELPTDDWYDTHLSAVRQRKPVTSRNKAQLAAVRKAMGKA